MAEDAERAYRDGLIDAKIASHEARLQAINGNISSMHRALNSLERSVERISDQMVGMSLLLPKVQTLEAEQETAARVAAALKTKTKEDRTRWEKYRAFVAWGLGVLTAFGTLVNLFMSSA